MYIKILILLSLGNIFLSCHINRKMISNYSKSNADNTTKTSDAVMTDPFMTEMFKKYPEYFDSLLSKNDEYQIQVIYTQIDRTKRNKARFTDYYFNLNPQQYFYPASCVKFPVAILALQRLNELNINGLDKNTTMITESGFSGQTDVYNDSTVADGRPTIAQYIKKILLVSDNDAFNRLYEFLGQEYINNSLHKMGYTNAQIIHRLSINLTEEQNRHTNPIKFFGAGNKVIYEKPLEKSNLVYASRSNKLGKGYYNEGILKNEPFDFSKKNRLALTDLHNMMKSIFSPLCKKKTSI